MNADERHLNLVFVLMNTRRPLTREELRTKVGGYDRDASDEAFQRMFERDKDALRESRVPIETMSVDAGFNDSVGYLIDRKKFLLPDLRLDAQDRVILSLAAKAWKDAQLSQFAEEAAGRIADTDESYGLSLDLGLSLGHEDAATLFNAITDGVRVRFDYLTKGDDQPKTRTVDPWQVVLSGGQWYLVGFDVDRHDQRTFKLARFKSDVTLANDSIGHGKPADFDIVSVVSQWRQSQDGEELAYVDVQHHEAGNLRLQAETISAMESHDSLTIRYSHVDVLARDIASVSDKVLKVEPVSLRHAVTSILRQSLQRHES